MRRLVLGLMTALSLSFMPVTAAIRRRRGPQLPQARRGRLPRLRPRGGCTSSVGHLPGRALHRGPHRQGAQGLPAPRRRRLVRRRRGGPGRWRSAATPSYEEWMGRSQLARALTAYGRSWFIPTKAERNQGARWVRCDVILMGGNTALAPLPYDAAPLVPNPITDSVRKCLTGKYYWTTCDRSHSWRASGDFNVRKGKYPTAKQMRAIAIKKCSPMVDQLQVPLGRAHQGGLEARLPDHGLLQQDDPVTRRAPHRGRPGRRPRRHPRAGPRGLSRGRGPGLPQAPGGRLPRLHARADVRRHRHHARGARARSPTPARWSRSRCCRTGSRGRSAARSTTSWTGSACRPVTSGWAGRCSSSP